MKIFKVFQQIPKIIYGINNINRLEELMPNKKGGYYLFIIDKVFENNYNFISNKINVNDEIIRDRTIKS